MSIQSISNRCIYTTHQSERRFSVAHIDDNQGGINNFVNKAYISIKEEEELEQMQNFELLICEAFQYYDTDHSGYLEKNEIKQMIDKTIMAVGGMSFDDEIIDRVIAHFDVDGDGRINIEEFKRFRDEMVEKLILEAFKYYDFNQSGY